MTINTRERRDESPLKITQTWDYADGARMMMLEYNNNRYQIGWTPEHDVVVFAGDTLFPGAFWMGDHEAPLLGNDENPQVSHILYADSWEQIMEAPAAFITEALLSWNI